MSHRSRLYAATCAAAAAAAVAAPAASAQTPTTHAPTSTVAAPAKKATDVDTHRFAQQSGAAQYWTADRMRKAKDRTKVLPTTRGRAATTAPTTPAGTPTLLKGQQPTLKATPQAPRPTIGKVFFTLGGKDYVCSANSVRATNKSLVSTAGHCVNEGPGAYATRFVFVPAYENGRAPYGRWTATSVSTPTQWSGSGDINHDTAFVVVAPLSGSTLADRVGATGVAFNQPRHQQYTSFGYPAAAPFNGETLQSCTGVASDDRVAGPGRTSQGIPCDMTGGSSGGPWFLGSGYQGASSVQNSVNSYGYPSIGGVMYGPYWGSVIQQAYTAAAARTS